jgi:hypothetical protein
MTYRKALAVLAKVDTEELINIFENEFGSNCIIDIVEPGTVCPGYVLPNQTIELAKPEAVIRMGRFMAPHVGR